MTHREVLNCGLHRTRAGLCSAVLRWQQSNCLSRDQAQTCSLAHWLAHNPTYNSLTLAYRPACLDTQSCQHRTHTKKTCSYTHFSCSYELSQYALPSSCRQLRMHSGLQLPKQSSCTHAVQHAQHVPAPARTPAPNACPRCCCGCCRAGRRRRSRLRTCCRCRGAMSGGGCCCGGSSRRPLPLPLLLPLPPCPSSS